MSARKQRSDATLKTLPEVVQEQLFALLRTSSYATVVRDAKEKWDIKTSPAALSEFFRWYPLSRRIETAKDTADQVAKVLRSLGDVTLDDDKIQKAAQAMFEAQAMKAGDTDAFVQLAKIRLARDQGKREERRIALLEKKAAQADEAAGVLKDKTLTEAERQARLREVFGM